MYILDQGNNRVQKWFPGASFGVTVLVAVMSSPIGMQLDLQDNIVIADTSYHRIISFAVVCRKS